MAQELAVWPQRQTTLSLDSAVANAKLALSSSTSPVEAAKAAKQLVGSYAHMKPGDPDVFVTSIAAVLSQYPLGLVRECCDPRTGVARAAKFLSVAELVEWLDHRLAHYQTLASHKPRPLALPPPVFTEEHKAIMRAKLTELFRWLGGRPDPIETMKREYRARAGTGA